MAVANDFPTVIKGAPVDPDLWYNPIAQAVTDHTAKLNTGARGVIKRGERTTSSSTTTTEVAVLRVDNVFIDIGRLLVVWTSDLALTSSVANDVIAARIRYTTDFTPATVSSAILGESAAIEPASIAQRLPLIIKYVPSSAQTLSLLLSVARIGGTGNCSMVISANVPTIDLIAEDRGLDVGDSGVDL